MKLTKTQRDTLTRLLNAEREGKLIIKIIGGRNVIHPSVEKKLIEARLIVRLIDGMFKYRYQLTPEGRTIAEGITR